ncbi:MAG: riboflavin synthase [[Clostridium] aminophilum]|uniref:riboflavin synthase n=1 Tax=[Clostridium] aminophilum TaxID=1526 RepID=UPI0026ED6B78|nr:riboflavin synthase [[Clostridium] aminophilum]MDD6196511.1 riboflavin synthase [[Clostridium] aminophilum]
MFTGIIEETGRIRRMELSGNSGVIDVEAHKIMEDVKIGDSIAVNGVCLTAFEVRSEGFRADVMAETVRRSSLGSLSAGQYVNLERAMASGRRFGGHIVTGHIDGTGVITGRRREENAVWVTIEPKDGDFMLIVEKGSVAVDGISLTVAKKERNSFSVSVIPHTGGETTLLEKAEGQTVNLEYDIVGKYVQELLKPMAAAAGGVSGGKETYQGGSTLTMEMLKDYGF